MQQAGHLLIMAAMLSLVACGFTQQAEPESRVYSSQEIDEACGYPVKFPVSDECLKRSYNPDSLRRESDLTMAVWATCGGGFTLNGREVPSPCDEVSERSAACILWYTGKSQDAGKACTDAENADPRCKAVMDMQVREEDACMGDLTKLNVATLDACIPPPDSPAYAQIRKRCQQKLDDLNGFYAEQSAKAGMIRESLSHSEPIPPPEPPVIIQQAPAPNFLAPPYVPSPPVFTHCTNFGPTTNCITH